MINPIIIKTNNLNVFSGQKQILKNINIEIPRNKITVILGPSGCGKTTLLKCINRLTDLYSDLKVSGELLIDDDNIFTTSQDITDIRKRMGLLSQRPYPLPMSIYENITFGIKINGRHNTKYIKNRVQYYLTQANLWDEVKDRLHDPASSLSIGQQQRLCLARGLAVDPDLILADEPTSALDPISSAAIEQKFMEFRKRYTIIMVTHFLHQAMRIADYVIFMYLGEVKEQGPSESIFVKPQQEITKAYLSGLFD